MFDEDAPDRQLNKENSFMRIDGDVPGSHYNPDEDGIDPITIYRF